MQGFKAKAGVQPTAIVPHAFRGAIVLPAFRGTDGEVAAYVNRLQDAWVWRQPCGNIFHRAGVEGEGV